MEGCHDQSQDFCCCGKLHVRTGALIVILITLVGSTGELINCGRPTPIWGWHELGATESLIFGLSGILGLLVSGSGIYASRQRVAWAWLPITVFRGVQTVHLAAFGATRLLLFAHSYLDINWDAEGSEHFRRQGRLMAVVAVIFVLLVSLSGWSTAITYGTYKWQKRDESKALNGRTGVRVALCSIQATSGAEIN